MTRWSWEFKKDGIFGMANHTVLVKAIKRWKVVHQGDISNMGVEKAYHSAVYSTFPFCWGKEIELIWSDLLSPFLCNRINWIASSLPMTAKGEKDFTSQPVIWRAVTKAGYLCPLMPHYCHIIFLNRWVFVCDYEVPTATAMWSYPGELHTLVGDVLWEKTSIKH